ncbi:MAG: GH116 family glycosyl-hydrolase [Planctomycetota bacterium]
MRKVKTFRTFTGRALDQVVFPLGGVGTGTIGLHGSGRLVDWEIFNAPNKETEAPATAFMIQARAAGRPAVTRMLAAPRMAPYASSRHKGTKYHFTPFQFAGLPHLEGAEFTGRYPFAGIRFRDRELPVQVMLTAFNPMVPHDLERSSIPAAAFVYTLKNPGRQPVRVSIGATILNMAGLSQPCMQDGTFPNGTWGKPFGKNVNERVQGPGYRGLLMTTKKYRKTEPGSGSLALLTRAAGSSVRTAFPNEARFDVMDYLWRDFRDDGRFDDAGRRTPPSPEGKTHVGGVTSTVMVPAGATREIIFVLGWHFPNVPVYWDLGGAKEPRVRRNHYARVYRDAQAAAGRLFRELDSLRAASEEYVSLLGETTLPQPVVEAVMSTASIIRTNTVQRFDDGFVHCFEGTDQSRGCCMGTCTHVWNYAHSMAHLYPALEQNCRETNFAHDLADDGAMQFRTRRSSGCCQPVKIPAADGQMGTIVRLYREWQLAGDTAWLKRLWPGARRSMEFAWKRWDSDLDGVMEHLQHNTYDVEFAGANTLCGSYYLAALKACREMALAAGDTAFAVECTVLLARGQQGYARLFNGDFYEQRYDPDKAVSEARQVQTLSNLIYKPAARKGKPDVKYQQGQGCLADQVIGDWQARAVGLGGVLPDKDVRATLRSIVRFNFRKSFRDFESVQRIYMLNEDAGLLLCTWPRGGRPELPFPYSDEGWTGIEYQVAAHCAWMGLVPECLTLAAAARKRHDGVRRNPFNDVECGDHYARALSAFAMLNGLAGFTYSAVRRHLGIAPRINRFAFRSFYATGRSWGQVALTGRLFTLDLHHGAEALDSVAFPGRGGRVRVTAAGRPVGARVEAAAGLITVRFDRTARLAAGEVLRVTVG